MKKIVSANIFSNKLDVSFHIISALYPFNEGHFPGIDTCNQLSLSVIDYQQVVIVADSHCVHHRVSVCKQLHRENTGVKG